MMQKGPIRYQANNDMQNNKPRGNFGELMIEAVDCVFSSLGEPCKRALYFHLKNTYGISREDIPTRIDDFAGALEEVFGLGAKLLEIEIMKLLFSKMHAFRYPLKQEVLLFTDYLKKLESS